MKEENKPLKNRVLPLDDDNIGKEFSVAANGEKKTAKTKKSNKKKEHKAHVTKTEASETVDEDENVSSNQRKWPCLLGFIAAWLEKRRERRMEKKRQAIASRVSPKPLEETDHTTDTEGEAFIIDADDNPISYFGVAYAVWQGRLGCRHSQIIKCHADRLPPSYGRTFLWSCEK